jgi:hypothetical protein
MTTETQPIWAKTIADFIQTEGLSDMASADEIVGMVLDQTLYWELPLDKGRRLMLVRLSSPVTVREEVLLGNILFNDFLNKSVIHAVNEARLGHVLPITNDLENAYFLIVTSADLTTVSQTVWDCVTEHLPDLFFADEDVQRGIHGHPANMFDFMKSDFDPFPYYAVPLFYASQLERLARRILSDLLDKPFFTVGRKGKKRVTPDFRTAQATMAAFYGRTSGSKGDCQSHPMFVARLASQEYQVFTPRQIREAFRLDVDTLQTILTDKIKKGKLSFKTSDMAQQADELEIKVERKGLESWFAEQVLDELMGDDHLTSIAAVLVLKDAVQNAIKAAQFDEQAVRQLLRQALDIFIANIDSTSDLLGSKPPASWFLPFLRKKGKLLNVTPEEYHTMLLHRVSFGPLLWAVAPQRDECPACRVCGDQAATIIEINILLGVDINKFYNQATNYLREGRHICARCALCSYLGTRLFGSHSVGRFPVPHQSNLIFHYGRHTPEGAKALGQQIGIVRGVLRKVQEARWAVIEANRKIKDDEEKRQRFGVDDEEQVMLQELQARLSAGELTPEEMARLQAILERMARQASQAREVIERVGSTHVVDIGLGEQRLIVFALENLYDERNLAQKTFARSRLPVFALLAFLQDICGCDGPYYFQALPRVDVEASSPGYFYIRRQRIEAAKYRRQYEAISAFARYVVPGFDLKAFKKRIKLAEELADHPLETFSQVLRRSTCIRGEKDSPYRLFTGEQDQPRWDRNLNIFESWAYLKALNTLRELEEVMHELE